MFVVPDETPFNKPVDTPMVATPVLLLVHEPPPVLLVNVIEEPTHTLEAPVIAAGLALTVKPATAIQPTPNE